MKQSIKYTSPLPENLKRLMDRVGSRKRSCYVREEAAGKGMRLRSYWDGGSRDEYAAWDANGSPIALPVSGAPMFTPEPSEWVPSAGDVLVNYGTFMGKPSTPFITFYV